jgi:hypothetical protein
MGVILKRLLPHLMLVHRRDPKAARFITKLNETDHPSLFFHFGAVRFSDRYKFPRLQMQQLDGLPIAQISAAVTQSSCGIVDLAEALGEGRKRNIIGF